MIMLTLLLTGRVTVVPLDRAQILLGLLLRLRRTELRGRGRLAGRSNIGDSSIAIRYWSGGRGGSEGFNGSVVCGIGHEQGL